MKFTWTNQLPPGINLDSDDGNLVSATASQNGSLIEEFTSACENLKAAYAALPRNSTIVENLIILAPSLEDIRASCDELDRIYRFNMTGRFGKVALLQGPELKLILNTSQIESNNIAVFRGYSPQELDDQYYTFFTSLAAQNVIPEWIRTELDPSLEKVEIVYGASKVHYALDIILPKERSGPLPLLVHIHGGYWQYTDKSIYNKIANSYGQHNVAVANLNHPQLPDCSLIDIIEACRSAVRYLYNNSDVYGFDRDKFSVAGHSSGAHLAACMGLTNWGSVDPQLPASLFNNVVLCSGLYNLEPFIHTTSNSILGIKTEDLQYVSPMHMPCGKGANFHLHIGSKESDEFQKQTNEFKHFLEYNKVPVMVETKQQGDHFSTADDMYSEGTVIFNRTLPLIV